MTADERRRQIREILFNGKNPITASNLAARFSVSRQVIVGDIALIRTGGMEIDSTPRGYIIHRADAGIIRQIVCIHSGEQLEDELNTIVDYGCKIINVIVDHPIYGNLTGALHISSRYDVQVFIDKCKRSDAVPLSSLTDGIHTHTLSCDSEDGYEMVKKILKEKGYLISAE